jgi:hypothetical protein
VAVQACEHPQDLLDRREDVRFGPAERGQPCRGETRLEIADIVVTELEVVDQVRSGPSVRRMGGCDVVGSCHLGGQHRVTHRPYIGLEGLELVTFARSGLHGVRLRSPGERKLNNS